MHREEDEWGEPVELSFGIVECDNGETYEDIRLGWWIFEPCPFHERYREANERCKICNEWGEVLMFFEK